MPIYGAGFPFMVGPEKVEGVDPSLLTQGRLEAIKRAAGKYVDYENGLEYNQIVNK